MAILKGISDALSLCKENAMYCENLSLNPDYIYLNPKELNVKLVYFPFETGRQTIPALERLLSKIIDELLVPEDSVAVEYIHRVRDCFNWQGKNPASLMGLVKELEAERSALASKKEAEAKKEKKENFWSRFFKKEKSVEALSTSKKIEAVSVEPVEPVEPIVELTIESIIQPQRRDGTQLLIQFDNTSILDSETKKMLQMTINSNGMRNQIEIQNFPCMLGRSEKHAQIVLDDKNASRKHAIVDFTESAFTIMDCNSKNGSKVNSVKLQPGKPKTIVEGDIIQIGTTELVVTDCEGV